MKTAKPHVILAGLLAMALIAGGCDLLGSEASSPSLSIETEREAYDLARDTTINVEIQNTSDQTLYYSTCLATSLEVLEEGRVVDTIGLGACHCLCPAELQPGEKVAPGVSRVFTQAFLRASERLREGSSISYRLAYGAFYRDEARDGEPLPRRERQSNEFVLRLP